MKRERMTWRGAGALGLGPLVAGLLAGCPEGQPQSAEAEVVVYCALDRLFAQSVLEDFSRETGVDVLPKWDTEATKTTGLVEAIRAEGERARCDVFWNNEVGQTAQLADEGRLAPYASPSAEGLPEWAIDAEHRWTGFAARSRVLIVNTDLVPEGERPTSFRDLADARWRGRVGIAEPLYGTTATHVAALWAHDPELLRGWLADLKANDVVICAGNADVKDRVASGELAVGLTDTDDLNLALLEGKPVAPVFPDQGEGELGTLLIPNSLAIVKGARNPEAAKRLVDWLLRPEIEERLAGSRSVQIPLREGLERAAWLPGELRPMPVVWSEVAAAFPAARAHVEDAFLPR